MAACLTASAVLSVWERGRDLHPVARALLVLAAAHPELGDDDLSAFSIGERDARLLDVHAATFGPELDATVACPRCGVALAFSLDARALRLAPGGSPADAWRWGDYTLGLRCLDSRDLDAAAATGSADAARRRLLERSVVEVTRQGRPVDPSDLPDNLTEAIADRLAQADPQADLGAQVTCAECGHAWDAVLDIGGFLWEEIAAQARQLLYEVHALARAYGWRESDILTMSPARRRLYLEMVG